MDTTICSIEISKTETHYIIRLYLGEEPQREYKSSLFEEVFEQVITEIQEEFGINQ